MFIKPALIIYYSFLHLTMVISSLFFARAGILCQLSFAE